MSTTNTPTAHTQQEMSKLFCERVRRLRVIYKIIITCACIYCIYGTEIVALLTCRNLSINTLGEIRRFVCDGGEIIILSVWRKLRAG